MLVLVGPAPGATAATIAGEQTLHAVDGVRFGVFRCPPEDWRWSETNPVGVEHYACFPRCPVIIEPADGPEVVATPAHLVVYDAGGTFRRKALDPAGDWCTFLAVDPGLVEGPRRRHGVSPVLSPRGYALQATLAGVLAGGAAPTTLVDDAVLALLDEALARTLCLPDPPAPSAHHRALARDAAVLLSSEEWRCRALRDAAAELGVSAYHLARVFRRHTGYSLHEFRLQLRLRAGLLQVAERPRDLAGLAADLGFAHHSHFTKAFRASFGSVPTRHLPQHLTQTLGALLAA